MGEIDIRKAGRAGRITRTRPEALNALTYDMVLAIEEAIDAWVSDDNAPELIREAIDASRTGD